MSIPIFNNLKFSNLITKYTIFLLIIIGITIAIRTYFFPSNVPLTADALYYFWYSSDIHQIGKLSDEWSPSNIGWPIFVGIFFTMLDSENIFTLMQIQKVLSVIVSILIIIPVYYLCKKFVARKFALIGATLIAFDPRLMINSFLGVTDSLYILLISTSLVLFFSTNKKIIYFSFVLISFATIVRGEGLVFFIVLSIMFLIKFRKEKYKIFFNYLIVLGIFILIVLPISLYQIEVTGNDGIFMRSLSGGNDLASNLTTNDDSKNSMITGLELFIKYLIWVSIPNFIIFIPLGLFLIFKKRNFEKYTIILLLSITTLPAFYAYMNNIQETRYLYVLFPMFSVLSVLFIEKIIGKRNRLNIMIVIIISSILVFSLIAYDQIKIDYEHEKEAYEIMKKISTMTNGINFLYNESTYLKTSQTFEEWPMIFTDMGTGIFKINTYSTNNFDSLEDFIIGSKNNGLTHIMVDDNKERQDFLVDIFENENNYNYLDKMYDSKIDGFAYHVKVFKINYKLMD